MDYNYSFFGIHLMWWTIWLIVLVSLITFFYFSKKKTKDTPLTVLQQKFSSGKISVDEYEQTQRQLYFEEDLKTKIFFLARMSKQ